MLDRGAAPDAEARRRVAIAAGVERDAFLFQQVGQLLGEVGLAVGRQGGDPGIDDLQADQVFERVAGTSAR